MRHTSPHQTEAMKAHPQATPPTSQRFYPSALSHSLVFHGFKPLLTDYYCEATDRTLQPVMLTTITLMTSCPYIAREP